MSATGIATGLGPATSTPYLLSAFTWTRPHSDAGRRLPSAPSTALTYRYVGLAVRTDNFGRASSLEPWPPVSLSTGIDTSIWFGSSRDPGIRRGAPLCMGVEKATAPAHCGGRNGHQVGKPHLHAKCEGPRAGARGLSIALLEFWSEDLLLGSPESGRQSITAPNHPG